MRYDGTCETELPFVGGGRGVSYQHDEQAVEEAAQFALPGDKVDEVSAWLSTAQSDLGAEGVLGHRIHYDPQKWEGLLPALLLGRDSISRGEVFAMAAVGDLGNVFTASYIWGVGRVGYGPRRLRDIIDSTGGLTCSTNSSANFITACKPASSTTNTGRFHLLSRSRLDS